MLKFEWKRAQVLADEFWSRWKRDYLNLFQPRRKLLEDVYKRWRRYSFEIL